MSYPRGVAAGLVALVAAAAPAPADGLNPAVRDALGAPQRAALERVIEQYILEHPEVLRRALAGGAVARPGDPAAFIDPEDGTLGAVDGDVAVVAFIDRASPHSRAMLPILIAVAATDPGVRVALKELPLLSEASVEAALAAVAARRQGDGAFRRFEAALMGRAGPPDAAALGAAAAAAELDVARWESDRADPGLHAYLARTRALADGLGVNGTPAILIGPKAFAGTQSIDTLRAAVAAAREAR